MPLKSFSVAALIAFFAFFAGATPVTCPITSKVIYKQVDFQICKTMNPAAVLPQVKFYHQRSEIFEAKSIALVKGFISGYNHNSTHLEDFTALNNATIRLNITEPAKITSEAFFDEANLNPAEVASFGMGLQFGLFPLYNLKVTKLTTPAYTTLAPAYFNQYILPEAKIDSIVIEPLNCKNISGQAKAIETCQISGNAENQSCDCTYTVVK